MASKYFSYTGFRVFNGDLSDQSDINSPIAAIDLGFEMVAADFDIWTVSFESYRQQCEDWAIKPTDVEPGLPSAKTSADNALTYSTAAGGSATAAAGSASAAASSASAASGSADAAASSANSASTSASNAATSASDASASAAAALASQDSAEDAQILAEAWASNPQNVEVVPGKYSAYHWALYAEDAAAGYTPAGALADLLTVDGTGSGLDADLLDGQHGSYYAVHATVQAALDTKAPLASPVFSGDPTAPTPSATDSSESLATTQHVSRAFPGSASASGYQKFKNGTTIQWGQAIANATPGTSTTVTFPIAFTSVPFAIVCTSFSGVTSLVGAWFLSPTATNFALRCSEANGIVKWIAIGFITPA